jgi:hypothetical protein
MRLLNQIVLRSIGTPTLTVAIALSCSGQVKGPTLAETTDWMKQSLATHNGQRLEIHSPDVKVLARLTAGGCKFDYVVTNYESVHYDMADIDPKSIQLEKIGKATWVTFKTTNYHRSIRYMHAADPGADYSDESGGFSLDTEEHAQSFLKALHRVVDLCGGKPSTF